MAQEIVDVPMTGKILSCEAKEGDSVQEGDVICILESMKMENPIVATVSGKIIKIGITKNQVVKPGETIAIIEY